MFIIHAFIQQNTIFHIPNNDFGVKFGGGEQ